MGIKRKSRGQASRPEATVDGASTTQSRFDVNERFEDSEDEFAAGRDQILLDEAPEAKRRRRLEEEGMCDDRAPKDLLSVTRLLTFAS
jgi:U3 small nucleolar RNA-associated protein 3